MKRPIAFRLPEEMVEQIDQRALAVNKSRNAWVELALAFALNSKGAKVTITNKKEITL